MQNKIFYVKGLLFLFCLLPLGFLVWGIFADTLGANPIEEIQNETGIWALRLLLVTLAVRPAKECLALPILMRVRRMLGLFVFFYLLLHIFVYLVLDQFFDWQEIVKDVVKRPFITVGFTAFLLLIPLAATSTDKMMRRFGSRWKSIHRFIYLISILVVLHFLWSVKADVLEPLIYLGILILLLLYRLVQFSKKKYAAMMIRRS